MSSGSSSRITSAWRVQCAAPLLESGSDDNASFHVAVDPEGVNLLTAANGPGGKRTLLHNRIQDLLIYEASQAGIQASAGRVIDTRAALHASNWQGTASPTPEEPPGEEEEEGRGRRGFFQIS